MPLPLVRPGVVVEPDRPALLLDGEVLTFGQLEERVERLARVLVARGLRPGEPVAVMLGNRFEFLEVGLATARVGCRLLPLNWHLKTDEVAWILADAGARLLVVEADLLPVAGTALRDVPDCTLLVVGDRAGAGPHYEEALEGAGDTPVDPVARQGRPTPRYLFYTSGTTGRPRGVDREELPDPTSAVSAAVADMWGLGPDDVFLVSSPLYHAAGAYAFISLFAGSSVVVLPRFTGVACLAAVDRHRVTTGLMVPAHFIRILEVPEADRAAFDTSSLRLLLHSAAPCPVPVKHAILAALPSAEIWEFYGASEGGATRISPEEWQVRPGSVGRPWPGVTVTIRDDAGLELPAGQTGRIYLSAPQGRFRYHNDPAKTEEAWLDDAFTLGDVGHLDADGYLFITDRAADLVIRGGVNIYPAEIERVLHQHPDVVDCAVLGVPDARLGEVVVALVEVRRSVDPADLQAWCRRHLADFKCPARIELVAELPRDPSGKVRKRDLRDGLTMP